MVHYSAFAVTACFQLDDAGWRMFDETLLIEGTTIQSSCCGLTSL
jgi:hypothetical protein